MSTPLSTTKLAKFTTALIPTSLTFSQDVIEDAFAQLNSSEFPTTRNEQWKYTRVGKIAAIEPQIKTEYTRKLPKYSIAENAVTFVFENGIFRSDLSYGEVIDGVTIKPLTACTAAELASVGQLAKNEGSVFNSMNSAYASDGIYVNIAPNTHVQKKIQIIQILTGNQTVANTRNYLFCDKFSKADLIFGAFSNEATTSFNNVVTEIFVEENANLTIDKIQYEEAGNYTIATENVQQAKDSTFTINTLTLNGTLVRNNLTINVAGTNCTTNLNGAYLLNENQHVDNHTVVDHLAPHCNSNELYKGVIDDKGTAVFNGKVFVRKDAQKINAFQSNGNVLLSDNASVNSKPELEIYADDVKCSHGSTTGQLDEEAVFYLRARGLSEKSARHLMVSAFIGDVLEKIASEDVQQFTQSILKERFGWEF
jgi:Fe-S cluster assembly protein SufD